MLPNAPRVRAPAAAVGNFIDGWYFASLGVKPRLHDLMMMSCGAAPSFGPFLASRLYNVSVPREKAMASVDMVRKSDSWGFYSYAAIRPIMPYVRRDLQAAMRDYAATYDPSLVNQEYEGGDGHMVVQCAPNLWAVAAHPPTV